MNKKYFSYANEIANTLRKNNINTEIYSDPNKNLGKQLTYANKKGNPVACIIGDNEFKDKTITLKNLLAKKSDNNQSTIKKDNLINEIKNLSNKILKTIKSRGFKFIELPPVIETNHILQRSGENFRKYLFSFNNSKVKNLL